MSFLDISNIGTNKKNISIQNVLLFAYSAIVTFALVLVLCKNFENREEANEEKLAVVSNVDVNNQHEVTAEVFTAEEESFDNPEVEWTVEGEENQPETKEDVVVVEKGAHFIGILQKIGMEYQEASQAASSLKAVGYDVRSLRVGQKINIKKTVDVPFGELLSVDKITIEASAGVKYVLTRNEDEKFVAEKEELELKTENKVIEGSIDSSLAVAMGKAGIPQSVIGNFINIFAYTVDFRTDIKAGNTFKVLFDRKVSPDGKVIKNGDILYAELNLNNDKIALYRYKDKSGGVDYYNEKGLVLKRSLDRKPMEFRSARISSRFGWRKHPILKRRILHSGVDYAAPTGSRIYASGDGVIKRAQWAGGYGKYVVIRHNSEYSTGYAHMSNFARGIKPGVRVKQGQVIGYVGSTGRSTGPHLHFEIIKNGKKVDPLKVKAATGTNLSGTELARFKEEVKKIVNLANEKKAYASAENDSQKSASN